MVEGNRIELSCEVKSIYNFSVMKINNGGLIRSLPKPRIAYKYKLTEGEDIMMLVPGENGRIQEGKIQFDEEMPNILSSATILKGTPVFNRNGVWIGSVLYTFEGAMITLDRKSLTRDRPPRERILQLQMLRGQNVIVEEIAKFPGKWEEIARKFPFPETKIAEIGAPPSEVERCKSLILNIGFCTVRDFKIFLAEVGLASLAEHDVLKNEHYWSCF